MKWLNKLERKFHGKSIKGLTNYLVGISAMVFLLNYLSPDSLLIDKLSLNPNLVLQGEVWRLITFIFIPPSFSPFWILFALYFFYLVGNGLEQEWGSFKFNFYYFTGIIGTIISAFISGGNVTIVYLNLSLFLAFAYIYPDYEILLFFIIPLKVKYLAALNWIVFIYSLITVPFGNKIAIVFSLINFFLYFTGDIINNLRNNKSAFQNKRKYQTQLVPQKFTYHKCTICGKTEKDDPNLEFRYCSKCDGNHEYCSEHLFSHEHIKKA